MHIQDNNKSKRTLLWLILICLFLQAGISPHITFISAHANFALIFAVCMAYSSSTSAAIIGAFFAGLFYDLMVGGPVGLMSFELVIVVLIIGGSERGRFGESPATLIKTFALTSLCVVVFYGIVLLFLGRIDSFVGMLFYRALPEVVLDVIAFLPFVFVLSRRQAKSSKTFRSTFGNSGGLSSKSMKPMRHLSQSSRKGR